MTHKDTPEDDNKEYCRGYRDGWKDSLTLIFPTPSPSTPNYSNLYHTYIVCGQVFPPAGQNFCSRNDCPNKYSPFGIPTCNT